MRIHVTVGLLLLFLVGCIPNYRPRNFSDTELTPDHYTVRFTGATGWSKGDAVEGLTLLRAGELTLEKGYRYFVVLRREFSSTVVTLDNPLYDNFEDSHRPGALHDPTHKWESDHDFPHVPVESYPPATIAVCSIDIQLFREKPRADELVAYDAAFVQRALRHKYGLGPAPPPPDDSPGDDGT